MALTNEEILDAIASKTVLEISELIKMMEEKFGVTATAAVAVAGPAAGAAAAPGDGRAAACRAAGGGGGAVLGGIRRRAADARAVLPRPAAAGRLVLRGVSGASCLADTGVPAVRGAVQFAAGRDVPGISGRQLCAGRRADSGKPPAWQGHKKAGIKIKDA